MGGLRYAVEHVFMPPKLPQTAGDPTQELASESTLARYVARVANNFPSAEMGSEWMVVVEMLKALKTLHGDTPYTVDQLRQRFVHMQPGDVTALLIRKQNAGLIIRRGNDNVVFEVFEVSAPSATVVQAEGKLIWTFPAFASEVPIATFQKFEFQKNLASFLVHMNQDELDLLAREARNIAVHPKHISVLLMAIMNATGGEDNAFVSPLRRVTKRIADEAHSADKASGIWRRSPLYLLIRVAIQTTLVEPIHYKAFMLYFMASLLKEASKPSVNLPSATLSHMCSKIARRAAKMGDELPQVVIDEASFTCEAVREVIQARWEAIQSKESAPPVGWSTFDLDIYDDCTLQLLNSSAYITNVIHDHTSYVFTSSYVPKHARRLCNYPFNEVLQQNLKTFAEEKDASLVLADFEAAVRDNLDAWVDMNLTEAAAPGLLEGKIKQYMAIATDQYKNNAENQSLMVLVVLELWMALDKIVIERIPLLASYSPEVSIKLLEPLLFRSSGELARVREVALYIRRRASDAEAGNRPSIFAALAPWSFCAQYYTTSQVMKDGRTLIERKAQTKRDEKIKELREKNAEYTAWVARCNRTEHDENCHRFVGGRKRKRNYCARCSLDSQHPTITKFEWPLPDNELQQKNMIFELYCPKPFALWREATYYILHDRLTFTQENHGHYPARGIHLYMTDNQGLLLHNVSSNRITVASKTATALGNIQLPAQSTDVCVKHHREWELFDTSRQRFIPHDFHAADTILYGTLTLPNTKAYNGLQYAVTNTNHTENQVMARQAQCPYDLSLHEYTAFGTLRSGSDLQWMNISRAFATRSLTFNAQPVYVLISQAAQQLGKLSPEAGTPKCHVDLKSPAFSASMLKVMKKVLDDSVDNWREVATVKTIVLLACRLLSALDEEGTPAAQSAHSLLRTARDTTYKWLKSIIVQLETTPQDEVDTIKARICEIAATCCLTYDVDKPALISDVEDSPLSNSDLTILIHSLIAINANSPSKRDTSASPSRLLLDRAQRLLHSFEERIWKQIYDDAQGLDDAVRAIWSAHQPGSAWQRMASPNERWLFCKTQSGHGRASQNVQINLLSGELFIDGKPIGNLPKKITEDPVYTRLFGKAVLRVVPPGVPGMDYKSVLDVSGYEVFFATKENGSVVIRTRSLETSFEPFLEYIPPTTFQGDVPVPFIENYVHWLNLDSHLIELRPLTTMWEASSSKWNIDFDAKVMKDDRGYALVEKNSPSFQMVYKRLQSIEDSSFVVITKDNTNSLNVDLPRLHLEFFLDPVEGDLESRTYPDNIVAEDQTIQTLYGLRSKLILRERRSPGADPDLPEIRRVLIPRGLVKFSPSADGNHVEVLIDTDVPNKRTVPYLEYTANTKLGMLVGNGSLESRLFKIYMHALTTHCAPDPLLGRTGVEEALNELRSEACLSFQHLETAELALLDLIRDLTPRREFHPPRKQETEAIRWHDIPSTCQITGFEARIKDIIAYNEKLAVFRETVDDASAAKEPRQHSPPALLKRAAARELGFANLLSAWSSDETVCDTVYHSRDSLDECSEAAYAAALAVILEDPRKFPLPHPPDLYKLFKNHWSPMVKRELGNDAPLVYDRSWLGKSDFSRTFLSLYDLCTSQTYSADEKKYSLLFSLPALAFGGGEEMRTIPYLIAFALLPERFSEITTPRYTVYDLQYGSYPRNEDLQPILQRHVRPVEQTPSHGLMQLGDEEPLHFESRRRKHHNERAASRKKDLAKVLLELWSSYRYNDALSLDNDDHYATYLNTAAILVEVGNIFQQCHRNKKLKAFATQIQNSLSPLGIPREGGIFPSLMTMMDEDIVDEPRPRHVVHTPFVDRLLREREPPSLDDHVLNDLSGPGTRALSNLTSDAPSVVALERTLAEFSETDVPLQSRYGRDTQKSLVSLKASLQQDDMQDDEPIDIGLHLANCRADFGRLSDAIQSFLAPQSESERLLSAGGSWPRLNTRVLLHQMSRTRWLNLSAEWQAFLVTFAISIVRLQQAERLSWLAGRNKREEVERELGNLRLPDASLLVNHPDWLLIMIEQNFFARAIQIRVALEMFAPSSGKNTALQLNMGEGKSSVIAPMVATSLADGNKLVRIVVLKPLAKQMYQLLVDRLSSLPNRRICYFPFSRQMKAGPGGMTRIHNLNMQCMLDGGIVVIQPEHILSAKLLTIDKMLSMVDDGAEAADQVDAQEALAAQHWLEDHSRDILDESDEVLHVRYQLIYTKGTQFPMEGHPQRWTVIQEVLCLAARIMDKLKADADEAGDKTNLLEVSRRVPSAFPHIKIPQHDGDDIAETLRSQIVEAILEGELPCLNITRFNNTTKKALGVYLANMEANNEGITLKRNLSHSAAFNVVLILRGVLVYGLLLYALQDRRWRVDYGLDLSRLLLAVPYRAKDLPSLRSEFGHPDIAILLTCLAYYYHGLNREQMDATLKHLLMLSNPVDHYEQWIRVIPDDDLPAGLRDINGINIDDARQRNEIFELFRYNRVVVDFYLANIVFPKAAKEFPHKLPTSGWDLAEKKAYVTTGFSGTNDNRYLLPTSITQEDPVDQGGTNALVLTYLLRPENASYHCTRNRSGKSSSGIEIVDLISKKPTIRVLLDVGAQMLDMSNQALVTRWLERMPADVEAGIFFNSDDEFTTITRAGIVEPLISSPFKQQTGKCIVYLDDAHTRGTDLKLPLHWQAAVTLGKKVTKDRLVQGCMRMRQLGRGQSLAFYAPPEIDAAIRRVAEKPTGRIKISDVIKWCMLETCADIEHHVPQWVQQGIDYDARRKALQTLRSVEELTEGNIRPVESVWLQKEARTLAEMYEGGTSVPIGRYIRRHPLLAERLTMMGLQALAHDNMDEEQEREVIHEMEVERHPERPPPLEDMKHGLDPDVVAFVKTGVVKESSPAFHPIPTVLHRVRYWSDHSSNDIFDNNLLVTTDFALTVHRDGAHRIEVEFWKQAHWFLSTNIANADPSCCYVVLVSQWELQRLLPHIRNKGPRSHVRLHLYSPKVTRSAQSFDDLSFFSIPPLQANSPQPSKALILQLNLFSGQLYPTSFEDYSSLCEFLGLDITGTFNSQSDGFVLPANRKESFRECPFTVSPVRFLKELMAVRRKGHDFGLTPIGKLLNGHRMTAEDFE